jgi:formylglycine-generating enzyme required for sulfatase activity
MKARFIRNGLPGLCFVLGLAFLVLILAGCPTGGDDAGGPQNAGDDLQNTDDDLQDTGGEDDGTVYTVIIDPDLTGAAITAEPASGKKGTEITLTITPEENKVLVPGSLKYTYGTQEKLINASTKKFSLPASDVTVYAEFAQQYAVTVDPSLEGIISASPVYGAAGTKITLSVTDPSKHILPETFGYDAGSGLILLKGAMDFTLPASDVTIAGEAEPYADLFRRMVTVNGGTVSASIGATSNLGDSPFYKASAATPVIVDPYSISAVEVSHELWYTVCIWAGNNGYTFQGNSFPASIIAAPADNERYKPPVISSGLSWYWAIVWCNAYSEWAAATLGGEYADFGPLYTTSGGAPLREFIPSSSFDTTSIPRPAHNARGFRLPTWAEWEFAARGGDPEAAAWSYTYAGSSAIDDVAWYSVNRGSGYGHDVGTKLPNTLGLYDMNGNFREFVWDYRLVNGNRYVCGGNFIDYPEVCEISSFSSAGKATTYHQWTTFRVAGPASIGVSP